MSKRGYEPISIQGDSHIFENSCDLVFGDKQCIVRIFTNSSSVETTESNLDFKNLGTRENMDILHLDRWELQFTLAHQLALPYRHRR